MDHATNSSSVHPTPKARKPLKVVVKKATKHRGTAKPSLAVRQRQVPGSHQKRGLPSFVHNRKKVDELVARDNDNDDLDPLQQNDDDDFFVNLACDTLLAIRTLHQQRYNDPNPMPSCLEIPVDDGSSIQGVLECQLHEFFTTGSGTKGGSSPVVSQELDQLLRNNTLRRLSNTITANTAPITVYIFTKDYQRAARAAVAAAAAAAVSLNTTVKNKEASRHSRQHGQVVLDWFCFCKACTSGGAIGYPTLPWRNPGTRIHQPKSIRRWTTASTLKHPFGGFRNSNCCTPRQWITRTISSGCRCGDDTWYRPFCRPRRKRWRFCSKVAPKNAPYPVWYNACIDTPFRSMPS